jgi:phosphoglycerate dehydrogenase-like enzyme
LDGATLGIIGFGRIGQMLAELIRPFNVTILAYDPYVSNERAKQLETELVDLEALLERSDFISIHAALTDETQGLIDRDRMRQIKPGAYIVNLARGGLIESLDVLYEALESGKLGGVGLDVFQPEPPDVSHPIFQSPNCVTSPHALGLTPQAMTKIFESMANDMAAVFNGKSPRHVVNPEVFS